VHSMLTDASTLYTCHHHCLSLKDKELTCSVAVLRNEANVILLLSFRYQATTTCSDVGAREALPS
jgi:hypothetical protein